MSSKSLEENKALRKRAAPSVNIHLRSITPSIESRNAPLCNKESHTQLKEDTILVANGKTNPTRSMPNLSHGNEQISFIADLYKLSTPTSYTDVAAFNTINSSDEDENNEEGEANLVYFS